MNSGLDLHSADICWYSETVLLLFVCLFVCGVLVCFLGFCGDFFDFFSFFVWVFLLQSCVVRNFSSFLILPEGLRNFLVGCWRCNWYEFRIKELILFSLYVQYAGSSEMNICFRPLSVCVRIVFLQLFQDRSQLFRYFVNDFWCGICLSFPSMSQLWSMLPSNAQESKPFSPVNSTV